ncbi:hypothetical protein ACQPX6_28455 [Actinomycetospora sp. CA-101289]|uniref:hypothetical protein n=1 Tax=Actinomycetospora sp. CA-101289 TaxID=3239893 RepID=UPI003D9949E1
MSNDDKRPTLGFDGRTVNPSDLERMALEQLAAEVAGEQQSDDNTVEVVVTRGMLRR